MLGVSAMSAMMCASMHQGLSSSSTVEMESLVDCAQVSALVKVRLGATWCDLVRRDLVLLFRQRDDKRVEEMTDLSPRRRRGKDGKQTFMGRFIRSEKESNDEKR